MARASKCMLWCSIYPALSHQDPSGGDLNISFQKAMFDLFSRVFVLLSRKKRGVAVSLGVETSLNCQSGLSDKFDSQLENGEAKADLIFSVEIACRQRSRLTMGCSNKAEKPGAKVGFQGVPNSGAARPALLLQLGACCISFEASMLLPSAISYAA